MRCAAHRTPAWVGFAVLLLLGASGCNESATPEDRRLLKHVAGQHQGRFELEPESSLYLRLTLRPEEQTSETEMQQVYREFFFRSDGSRRNTPYVYLNVYDARDRFLFQLYYDPSTGKIVRSAAERY